MTGDIRQFLAAQPFEEFTVITSGGNRYAVPTPDHADVNPNGSRVVIWFDDDSSVTISGLHITAIEKKSSQPA